MLWYEYMSADIKYTIEHWTIFTGPNTVSLETTWLFLYDTALWHASITWMPGNRSVNCMTESQRYIAEVITIMRKNYLILGRMKEETFRHFLSVVKLLNSYLAT